MLKDNFLRAFPKIRPSTVWFLGLQLPGQLTRSDCLLCWRMTVSSFTCSSSQLLSPLPPGREEEEMAVGTLGFDNSKVVNQLTVSSRIMYLRRMFVLDFDLLFLHKNALAFWSNLEEVTGIQLVLTISIQCYSWHCIVLLTDRDRVEPFRLGTLIAWGNMLGWCWNPVFIKLSNKTPISSKHSPRLRYCWLCFVIERYMQV